MSQRCGSNDFCHGLRAANSLIFSHWSQDSQNRKTQQRGRGFFIADLGLMPLGLALGTAATFAAHAVDELQDFHLNRAEITDGCSSSLQLRFGEWK